MEPEECMEVAAAEERPIQAASRKRRQERQWKQLVKRAQTWKTLHNDSRCPSFIIMTMKDNHILYEGPSHMDSFVNDPVVQQKFKEACLQRMNRLTASAAECDQAPAPNDEIHVITLPYENPEHYTWTGLCCILPKLVIQSCPGVTNKKWSEDFKPEWWPDSVPFCSPNNSRKLDKRLTVNQMKTALRSYLENCVGKYVIQEGEEEMEQSSPTVPVLGADSSGPDHCSPSELKSTTSPPTSPPASSSSAPTSESLTSTSARVSSVRSLENLDASAKSVLRDLQELASWQSLQEAAIRKWEENLLMIPPASQVPHTAGTVDRKYNLSKIGGYVYKSAGFGDCLYCSLSFLHYGDESAKHLLRLGALIYACNHLEHMVNETVDCLSDIDDAVAFMTAYINAEALDNRPMGTPSVRDLVSFCYTSELMTCRKIGTYSGLLQVKFLSGAIGHPIQQHCMEPMDIYEECMVPCKCEDIGNSIPRHILWVQQRRGGSYNHIQPVKFTEEPLVHPTRWKVRSHRCIFSFKEMCVCGQDCDTWVQCDCCKMWAHTMCCGMPDDSSCIPFSCCQTIEANPLILTWPNRLKKPKVHEVSEDLYLSDIRSLYAGNGLSCAVINFYLKFILNNLDEDKKKKVLVCHTDLTQHLFEKLKSGQSTFAVDLKKKHLPRDRVKDKSVVLLPVNFVEQWHWALVVCCLDSQCMFLLDSLNVHSAPRQALTLGIGKFLKECEKGSPWDLQPIQDAKVPSQEGLNCGVHVLENAEKLLALPAKELSGKRTLTVPKNKSARRKRSEILTTINSLATYFNEVQ